MRDRFLISMLSALFLLILAGLFYNQIIRYGYYSQLSRNNSIRVLPIEGPRGSIYDRKSRPVVTSRLSFDVAIIYQQVEDRKKLVNLLKDVLGLTGPEIAGALERSAKRPYASVTVASDIDKNKALALEEASFEVSGLVIETRSKRDYLYKHYGSHVFGYLSEITDDELETMKDDGYRIKDLVGRGGIEKYYQSSLRGIDGGTQIEVDNRGRQTRVLGLKEPESGKDLYLTIDIRLQVACDKLLGDHKGVIVVMDPSSGEILAMASHPSFDPNVFVMQGRSDERLGLLNDRVGRPMSNKSISGTYPPGSVFKVVTSSAGLEEKKITRYTQFFCPGYFKLGSTQFNCWKSDGHGPQNVVDAMMNSCNVFFYSTGRALGVDRMETYTKLFGYGKPTGIDLTDEVGGIAPGREWKRLHIKSGWYDGDTINYSIGQGYLLVTPLQVLVMVSAMANNGNIVCPHLVKRIGNEDLQVRKPRNLGLRNDTMRDVRSGLFEAINGASGTGKRAKADGVIVAGKTGTAQNPQGATHAWFCGFAPFSDPKISLVVFLEHGGRGGMQTAEIARGVIEECKKEGYVT